MPNGSLGEYQTLTDDERAAVVRTAVDAAGPGRVLPGVSAYGSGAAVRWAEQAGDAGCRAVMCLPPNAYRADDAAVVEHFRAVAAVGLPVVAYNNPYDTKVDLTPELLARLHGEGLIARSRSSAGTSGAAYRITELAPGLEVMIGADDVVVELAMAGAVGWIAGFPNSLPAACVELYKPRPPVRPASALPRTVSCIRCCAGIRGPSSCRRSSWRWTRPAVTAARAGRRDCRWRRPSRRDHAHVEKVLG